MENTVNKRIMLLKKELGLTDVQFCGRADISTFTLHKIKNNEEISQKIVFSIIDADFNVNKEWLLTGKGKMFAEAKQAVQEVQNPYRDALVSELKQQVTYLQEMLKMALGGKLPANFRNALDKAAGNFVFPNRKQNPVSGANA